jgi:hypothetical protein
MVAAYSDPATVAPAAGTEPCGPEGPTTNTAPATTDTATPIATNRRMILPNADNLNQPDHNHLRTTTIGHVRLVVVA